MAINSCFHCCIVLGFGRQESQKEVSKIKGLKESLLLMSTHGALSEQITPRYL